uniref:Uncharacterized protein n=1 Tax=Elaeophora elaphi TaxID=1147741 RepID=A0A0R3RP93_9BILA
MTFEKSSTNFIILHAEDNKIYGINSCLRTWKQRDSTDATFIPVAFFFEIRVEVQRCGRVIRRAVILHRQLFHRKAQHEEITIFLLNRHKIHTGLGSVYGYDENNGNMFKRILREAQLLFGSYLREAVIK